MMTFQNGGDRPLDDRLGPEVEYDGHRWRLRYDALLKELTLERPPPAEFTNVLNAIRDGSLVPVLNGVDLAAAPIPVSHPELVQEFALLAAMLVGLDHRGGDPELEARLRARLSRLALAAE